MDKAVIISIKGKQAFEDVEEDSIELVTEGRLSGSEEEGYQLSYQESEITGLGGTLTTFQVDKERITLLRAGEVNSQMVFEEGRTHFSLYETPYGTLTVGISTSRARANITEHGGDIAIKYAVEIDHAVTGENLFQINIREPQSAELQ